MVLDKPGIIVITKIKNKPNKGGVNMSKKGDSLLKRACIKTLVKEVDLTLFI